jgi:EAL domain-containing protein (putative c-di-GMP-specific phosphodiesterase class I)/CheY-like chemotaxis protein
VGTQHSVESVAILEDHEFQLEVAVALLKDCGVATVFTAKTGDDALNILRRQPVQVLICDLQTPGMDGVELIRHVAEEQLVHSIIIASGMDPALIGTVEEMARTYKLRVLGAIEKPLTRRNLVHMLQQYQALQPLPPRAIELMPLAEIALAVERRELLVHFQPKVSLASRECVGVEALVRLQHPTRGLVPPAAFIPVAENTPVMHDLTWVVLERSIAAWRGWGSDAWPLSLSINCSADVLCGAGVVDRIAAAVTQHSVEPSNIIWEVTESVLARDTAQLLGTLARLRLKGFGLSIDDFGTGYSSMQQLSRISFTELKIDRSFVHRASSRRHLRTILESSLELARKLKLRSVAEGVETEEDWNLLRELGCDVAQGYYIAKPMPAEHFWDWHARWTKRSGHPALK